MQKGLMYTLPASVVHIWLPDEQVLSESLHLERIPAFLGNFVYVIHKNVMILYIDMESDNCHLTLEIIALSPQAKSCNEYFIR